MKRFHWYCSELTTHGSLPAVVGLPAALMEREMIWWPCLYFLSFLSFPLGPLHCVLAKGCRLQISLIRRQNFPSVAPTTNAVFTYLIGYLTISRKFQLLDPQTTLIRSAEEIPNAEFNMVFLTKYGSSLQWLRL